MEYNPNIRYGTHKVKITLQQWDYTGHVVTEIGGNCKGRTILESAMDLDSNELIGNDCSFSIMDEPDDDNYWFKCVLKNDRGDTLQIEDECDRLDAYIVAAEIIDFCKG